LMVEEVKESAELSLLESKNKKKQCTEHIN